MLNVACIFHQEAQRELQEMEVDKTELEQVRKELANYFAEDESSFKLEECLKIFNTFCEKFTKAIEVRVVGKVEWGFYFSNLES